MSKRLLLMLLILWASFALRLHGLADQSLWFDETATGVSLRDARLNPLVVEAYSFLYYLIIAPSYGVMPNDFGLRWPSIVAGMLSIPVIFQLSKRIRGAQAGLIAAALLAISPYFIHYSREARHYSIVTLLTLIIVWLALHLKRDSKRTNLLFIATMVMLAGVHPLTVFWLLPLIGLLVVRRMLTGQGAGWSILIAAGMGVALTILAIRSLGIAGRGYLEGLQWIESLSLIQLPKKFMTQGLGIEWLSPLGKRVVVGVIGSALVIDSAQVRRLLQPDWPLLMLITVSFVPIAVMIAASFVVLPLWVLRYLTPSLVTFVLLVAVLVASIRSPLMRSVVLCALTVSGMLSYIVHPERQTEDWRSIKAHLERSLHDGDMVFACGAQSAVPLAYYMPDLPIYYLTNQPGIPDNKSSEELLTQTRTAPDVIPAGVRRVWIVSRTARICTLKEYGIDNSGLAAVSSETFQATGVIAILYQRVEAP